MILQNKQSQMILQNKQSQIQTILIYPSPPFTVRDVYENECNKEF